MYQEAAKTSSQKKNQSHTPKKELEPKAKKKKLEPPRILVLFTDMPAEISGDPQDPYGAHMGIHMGPHMGSHIGPHTGPMGPRGGLSEKCCAALGAPRNIFRARPTNRQKPGGVRGRIFNIKHGHLFY